MAGVCRYNIMLDPELNKWAEGYAKTLDGRSKSWVINRALRNARVEVEKKQVVAVEVKPKPVRKNFTPPKVEEVFQYCAERCNKVDAQEFIDHYQSNGWMRGKAKIKDWKACVRTWEKNSNEKSNNGSSEKPRKLSAAQRIAARNAAKYGSNGLVMGENGRNIRGAMDQGERGGSPANLESSPEQNSHIDCEEWSGGGN